MIGDVLASSILFEALKLKYPKSQLYYLINEHTYPVVQNNPFIDHFIFYTSEIEKSKLKLLEFAKSIKKEKFDIVIDAYSKLSSNLITAISGSKTKISKYKHYTSFIYTHTVKYKNEPITKAGLAVENRLMLLEPIDLDLSKNIIKPKIYLTDTERENAKKTLLQSKIELNRPLFMISVLGSGRNKTYPLEYMAKVIDVILKKTNAQILFNYIPKQIEEAKAIYNHCELETQKHIFMDVFVNDLRGFLALASYCNALIGNEGGAINMAKALSIPTFSIFSPWIDRNTWSIFEDDYNVSVHLKDFKPEIYRNKEEKKLKKDALSLYNDFKPSYFTSELEQFLDKILKK